MDSPPTHDSLFLGPTRVCTSTQGPALDLWTPETGCFRDRTSGTVGYGRGPRTRCLRRSSQRQSGLLPLPRQPNLRSTGVVGSRRVRQKRSSVPALLSPSGCLAWGKDTVPSRSSFGVSLRSFLKFFYIAPCYTQCILHGKIGKNDLSSHRNRCTCFDTLRLVVDGPF